MRFLNLLLCASLTFFCSTNSMIFAAQNDEFFVNGESISLPRPFFSIDRALKKDFDVLTDISGKPLQFSDKERKTLERLIEKLSQKQIEGLCEDDKHKIHLKFLLFMKNRGKAEKGKEPNNIYTDTYCRIADFFLRTHICLEDTDLETYHQQLINKFSSIIRKIEKDKEMNNNELRIYLSRLYMDYVDSYNPDLEWKYEKLKDAYNLLFIAQQIDNTAEVNFYLAKLIFQYFPPELKKQGTQKFGEECFARIKKIQERSSGNTKRKQISSGVQKRLSSKFAKLPRSHVGNNFFPLASRGLELKSPSMEPVEQPNMEDDVDPVNGDRKQIREAEEENVWLSQRNEAAAAKPKLQLSAAELEERGARSPIVQMEDDDQDNGDNEPIREGEVVQPLQRHEAAEARPEPQLPAAELLELLDECSKLLIFPPFPMGKIINDTFSKLETSLKGKIISQSVQDKFEKIKTLKATINDHSSEIQRQKNFWEFLICMRDIYRENNKTDLCAYTHLNMAKFLLETHVYPAQFSGVNTPKEIHEKLTAEIHNIKTHEKLKGTYKWSLIYFARLCMDHINRFGAAWVLENDYLEPSYEGLLEVKKNEGTKTVNYYLAKLILAPEIRYIPVGCTQQEADNLAREYLVKGILTIKSNENSANERKQASGDSQGTSLFPIKSAQPARLNGRKLGDYNSRALALLGVASIVDSARDDDDSENAEREENEVRLDAGSPVPPEIFQLPFPIADDDDPAVVADSNVEDDEDQRNNDNKPMRDEEAAEPFVVKEEARTSPTVYDDEEDDSDSTATTETSSDTENDEDQESTDDESMKVEDPESKRSISASASASGALQKAFEKAVEAEEFTDNLKHELKKKYPNATKVSSKVSLDEIRLILFLREEQQLSQTKISEHDAFFTSKVTQSTIRSILQAHGIIHQTMPTNKKPQTISVSVPRALQSAFNAAVEAEEFTDEFKRELEKRYPNAKKPKIHSTISVDEARLILFLKKDQGFSYEKISRHTLFESKVTSSTMRNIATANGVATASGTKSAEITDERKQEIFGAYLSIKAQKRKDLSIWQIGTAIASYFQYDKKEIVSQLQRLVRRNKSYKDNPKASEEQISLEMYRAGKILPQIQEATQLSFSAIANVIIDNIADEKLMAGFQITLPENSVDRDKKIVTLFRTLTAENGRAPTITRISEMTGHADKVCTNALAAADLVERQKQAKRLDKEKKEKIKTYWEENLPRWEKNGVLLKNRTQETAEHFAGSFNVTPAQVKGLCHGRSAVKPKQQSADSNKGLSKKAQNRH